MPSSEKQRARRRTAKLFVGIIKMILQKPEKITVSEWAEKYRILDESSNFSGKWTHDVTPYLVGSWMHLMIPTYRRLIFANQRRLAEQR